MNAQYVSITSDIIIALSAVAVAVVAAFGLSVWRKELTGKAKFDIARNVMLLAFKLRADFEWARNPGGWSWEYAGRTRQENEPEGVSQVLDQWYAKNQRLKPLIENLQKLQEVGWEAEVVLRAEASKRVSEAIKVFRRKYGELSSATYSYFEIRRDEVVSGSKYQDQDWLKELRKDIYSAKDDDFSKQIDEATNQLDSVLKAYVK